MKKKVIVTIGRQFGSGGHEIGEKLANALAIPFYDKAIIQMTAKQSGIHEELCELSEETATNSLLYSLSTGATLWGQRGYTENDLPLTDRIFIAQADVIRQLANQGSCVIVGRCADDILRENPDCIRVFIHASMPFRMNRIEEVRGLSEDKAIREIRKKDKKRASYYQYYTDKKWGYSENYTISLDSGEIGIDNAVEILKKMYELRADMADV
jgi:cytidylate kinase